MTKKDVMELKRRLKKNECTFTRMCGCYVDSEKNIVLHISETFLNLEDEEFYKYLEIAKKTLSGTVGNNLLELDFPFEEEINGGRQQSLLALKESKLKNEELLNSFYQLVIDHYNYAGNYLILVFHDAYDVMTKTSDNQKLDESEEVYEYLLCAICPVTLSKPGLGYRQDENRIAPRIRDWVVDVPETGFIFPAFTDRSTDIHSLMYYTKNAKDTHPEFMEGGLGCTCKQTATEQKETFKTIVRNALGDDEQNEHLFMEIQENLSNLIDEEEDSDSKKDPVILTTDTIQNVLKESGVSEEATAKIERHCQEKFGEALPVIENLIDNKALEVHAQKKKEAELFQKVQVLQQMLDEKADIEKEEPKDMESQLEAISEAHPNFDVILRVKPEKVSQISSQMIDGKKCIVIPLDEDEQANVNGIDTIL
ncbi:MAG: DUF4317 domain-containing protein [Clostridiales bacterium]|nr:DUF4317 domain-containing protein [Clostridiales bacterium]